MNNNIGSEGQWVLEDGTHKGIIDHQDDILVLVNNFSNGLDIDES
jgi:hypothetical protein